MKYILIKNATVIDQVNENHLKKADLLIESGMISFPKSVELLFSVSSKLNNNSLSKI